MANPKQIEVKEDNLVFESLKEACKHYGVTTTAYYQWSFKRENVTFEDYIKFKRGNYNNKRKVIYYKGKEYPSVSKLCKEIGEVSAKVLKFFKDESNLVDGKMHMEKYLEHKVEGKHLYKGKYYSVTGLLQEFGVSNTNNYYKKYQEKGYDIEKDGVEHFKKFVERLTNKRSVMVFGNKYKSISKFFSDNDYEDARYRSYLQWASGNFANRLVEEDKDVNLIEYYITNILPKNISDGDLEYEGKEYHSMKSLLDAYNYTYTQYYAWKNHQLTGKKKIQDFLDYKRGLAKDKD